MTGPGPVIDVPDPDNLVIVIRPVLDPDAPVADGHSWVGEVQMFGVAVFEHRVRTSRVVGPYLSEFVKREIRRQTAAAFAARLSALLTEETP